MHGYFLFFALLFLNWTLAFSFYKPAKWTCQIDPPLRTRQIGPPNWPSPPNLPNWPAPFLLFYCPLQWFIYAHASYINNISIFNTERSNRCRIMTKCITFRRNKLLQRREWEASPLTPKVGFFLTTYIDRRSAGNQDEDVTTITYKFRYILTNI